MNAVKNTELICAQNCLCGRLLQMKSVDVLLIIYHTAQSELFCVYSITGLSYLEILQITAVKHMFYKFVYHTNFLFIETIT
jgi:hypothetical protein